MDKPPEIYLHTEPERTLIPVLRSHLPYSGPVFRCIQHETASPQYGYGLATFCEAEDDWCHPRAPWLAAYVDIYRGPDQQVWVYSSEEMNCEPFSEGNLICTLSATDETKATIRAQLLELFACIRSELIVPYLRDLKASKSRGVTLREAATDRLHNIPPSAFFIGSFHTGLLSLLTGKEAVKFPGQPGNFKSLWKQEAICVKYLIPSRQSQASAIPLPADYKLGNAAGKCGVLPEHYALVNSRNHIKRPHASLCQMATSAAIYYRGQDKEKQPANSEDPVAWAFLNLDGSVCSMHVEPKHRGRGLASILVRQLLKEAFGERGMFKPLEDETDHQSVAYADIMPKNQSSKNAIARSGGRPGWTSAWFAIEVTNY